MFLASTLTLIMTIGTFALMVQFSAQPLGLYITKSAASDYLKKYEMAVSETAMKGTSKSAYMEEYSLQQVIDDLNAMVKEEEQLPLEMTVASFENDTMRIRAKSDSDYKRVFALAKEVFDHSNHFGVELTLINITAQIGEYQFNVPSDATTGDSVHAQIIDIVDENDQSIGTVTFNMNPNMVAVSAAFLIISMILLSLFTIIIVKLVSKIMTKSIMKPITQVNNQLRLMTFDDVENLSAYKLALKKPPLEVKEMIDYSNQIIDKFKDFSQQLETQNDELHMQNDELIENRILIENQQKQLIQSEKMASVGQIAAAVVHEINTPIGAIKSNAQMLDMMILKLESEPLSDTAKKQVSMFKSTNALIVNASDRVIQIVKSIKSFSRIDESAFKDADLHEAIESVLILTSNLWKSKIQIHKNYGLLPPVNCYISLINQVIMNLFTNAIDAIEDSGEITITTGLDENRAFIKIKDNGTGIAPEHLGRIFAQGFTTKPVGKGSGLGLALSKDIMDKHKGSIEVTSQLGEGSEFTIWIPTTSKE